MIRKLHKFVKMVLSPAESGRFIVENAKFLKINNRGIDKLTDEVVRGILSKEIDVENFSQHNLHPKPSDKHAIDWIFLIDTLNFCFWTPGNDTKWKVNNYTGYFGLCAAANRAMSENIDITNAKYYATITADDLTNILRSDDGVTPAPLIAERIQCLHEVGSKLIEKYEGKFENVIRAANGSAQELLQLVVTEFPCFRDEAVYNGQAVSIYKRAQILIGDVWACFRGAGLGQFNDIGVITMFADYRVPQVLYHFGTLEYSDKLMTLLKSDKIMQNGDPAEVEIRGASIFIVEELKDRVLKRLAADHPEVSPANVNSILLDHFLWDYRRRYAKELEYIPFHKTLSIYY